MEKLKDWLKKWHFESLSINAQFLEVELTFKDADKNAAWELYIELLTRIATQPLPDGAGDEVRALQSIYELFPLTREIIKRNGRDCINFTKIAVVVLNQVIRPFTATWHKHNLDGKFSDEKYRKQFRKELADLQKQLQNYTGMLAAMSGVEDLTFLEQT